MREGFLCPKCDNFAFLHTRQDQNELHLRRWFSFFLPKSTSSISRSQASIVQTYTQPYSFGIRIKLIICQIRHELSVTIQEISTSWKNVGWRTLYELSLTEKIQTQNVDACSRYNGTALAYKTWHHGWKRRSNIPNKTRRSCHSQRKLKHTTFVVIVAVVDLLELSTSIPTLSQTSRLKWNIKIYFFGDFHSADCWQ